jgi:hypothetical protein
VLEPGGRVVLVVPALKGLYGEIDRAIHHHRRYSRDEIAAKLRAAGLEVEHLSYFNMVGVPGWWLNAVVLRRRTVPGFQARINDALVPWLRLEREFGPPVGISLLAVGRVAGSLPRQEPGAGPGRVTPPSEPGPASPPSV